MKLLGKRLALLVSDGVNYAEVRRLEDAFKLEGAEVFFTSPHEFMSIETVVKNERGPDLVIDFPLDVLNQNGFDGIIIPDGILSVDLLRREPAVRGVIQEFHKQHLLIFASGEAVQILHDSDVLDPAIVLRDSSADIQIAVNQAVAVLLDGRQTYLSPGLG